MGKKMVSASVWTCHSLLSLYSKTVAFLFAVFCVVSGISAGTVSLKDGKSGKTISGRAFLSSDSSVLKNAKIFLGTDIYAPVYGVGPSCYYYALDSTVTDSAGNFKTEYPGSIFGSRINNQVVFAKSDSLNGADRFTRFFASDPYYLHSNSDTVITLYLRPFFCTGISSSITTVQAPFIKSKHGNIISIKVGNWSSVKNCSAEIINATGKLIASPVISADGVLNWDTKESARGVYFLKIKTKESYLTTQILLND